MLYNMEYMDGPSACPQPPGLPAALGLQPGEAVPISASLSVLLDGDRVVYFHFTDPVDSHAADDKPGRNRCLGRFALHGLASQAQLARALGVSPQTVGRARQRLEQEGEAGFAKPRKQRRRHGIDDPDLLARAAALLQSGRSVYSVARDLDVSRSTLWRYTQEGLLPASQVPPPGGRQAAASAPAGLPGKEERNRCDATAVLGRAAHDTEGRVAASLGLLDGREPRFEGGSAVSLGGVLTALPALLAAGLLRHVSHLELPKGFYGMTSVLLLWAFLLLGAGAQRRGPALRAARRVGGLARPGPLPLPAHACAGGRACWRRRRGWRRGSRSLTRDWCADDPGGRSPRCSWMATCRSTAGARAEAAQAFRVAPEAGPAGGGRLLGARAGRGAAAVPAPARWTTGMVSEIWNGIVPRAGSQLGCCRRPTCSAGSRA